MDEGSLDDTYDLLSPLRRSREYSDSFESFDNDASSCKPDPSPEPLESFSLSDSHRIPQPKYASTTRDQDYAGVKSAPSSLQPKISSRRKTSPKKPHNTTAELVRIPEEGNNADLSVWEDWLIKKLQTERESDLLKKQAEREAKAEERRLDREKEERKNRAEIKHQQWCEETLLKLKLRKSAEKREKSLQQELKAREIEEIKRKAKIEYEKWTAQQEKKNKEAKLKEKQRKELEKAEQEERRRKNEECFQNWLKKADEKRAQSPRTRPGDFNEYPSPSYRNPQPWVGPMADKNIRESVRHQHKLLIAEKHDKIRRSRPRPQTASHIRKGLVKTGPEREKSVLICRPATAAPLFYSVTNKNDRNFTHDSKATLKGRS